MRHILVVCGLLAGLAFPAAASAVVRGANVPAGDAPYAVALLAGASSSAEDWQRVFCGGSLVDARTVLTAAHCAARVPSGGAEVLAGRTNLLDTGGRLYTRIAAPAIASWLASALAPTPHVVASSGLRVERRQHPVVQDVRRLGPRRFQISGYVTDARRTTRVHVQRRVRDRWVMARRAAKLSADGRFRVVVRAPRWPRLRVMVVGSAGSVPPGR
jgi:hypothetical protein